MKKSAAVAILTTLLVFSQPAQATEKKRIENYIYGQCKIEYGETKAREKAAYYTPIILRAAKRHRISAPILARLIWHESNFNPRAVSNLSHLPAVGLMQIRPFPGRFKPGEGWFDPEDNINVGCRMLKDFHAHYHGDWHRALTAYNWGPGYVSRGMRRSRYSEAILCPKPLKKIGRR